MYIWVREQAWLCASCICSLPKISVAHFPKDSTKHMIDELLNNSLHLFYFILFSNLRLEQSASLPDVRLLCCAICARSRGGRVGAYSLLLNELSDHRRRISRKRWSDESSSPFSSSKVNGLQPRVGTSIEFQVLILKNKCFCLPQFFRGHVLQMCFWQLHVLVLYWNNIVLTDCSH